VVDGILVSGLRCTRDGLARFVAPTPEEDTAAARYSVELLELAYEASLDEPARFVGEAWLTYPTRRFVYADLPGPPRVLRFVAISANEEKDFKAVVASVSATEELIIDLRNLSVAGTMFRPQFTALDRHAGRTVWVAPGADFQKYLEKSFGVRRANMVKTMDEARALLEAKPRRR